MFRYCAIALLGFLTGCGADLIERINDDTNLNLTDGSSKEIAAPSFLTNYNSCEQITNDLRVRATKSIEAQMALWPIEAPRYLPPMPGCGDAAGAPAAAPAAGGGRVEGIDFSGTNNQEKGVDEADIIKIDGRFFYVINNDAIEILSIENEGSLEPVSRITLAQRPESMLLLDDKALVFSAVNAYVPNQPYYSKVQLDVIDLGADRLHPRLEKSYYFKGDLSGARRIANKIHLATYLYGQDIGLVTWPTLPDTYYEATPEEQDRLWIEAKEQARVKNAEILANIDFLTTLPSELERNGDEFVPVPLTETDCQRTFGSAIEQNSGFLSLISIDPKSDTVATQRVGGNYPTVYASLDQFIIASANQQWWWWSNASYKDETIIHQFKFDVNNEPNYTGSVAVPGALHNSFSLSEYNGYVRVATTVRRDWQDENSQDQNGLYILGDDANGFSIISSLENLAKGEQIWSARFTKDKGFLVTFRQVDPLFTLDLSDPKNPKVAGELKVPGVSTYLQDIGDGNLLAIGYSGSEQGLDWKTSISLFDVSEFATPRLESTLSLADVDNDDGTWNHSWSEANHNHLAINYFAPNGLTAIPISAYRYKRVEDDGEWRWPGIEYISKLKVIDTKVGRDLSLVGEIDHSAFYSHNDENQQWQDPQIRRSYFVGNYLYAFSAGGITVTRLTDMITTGSYEIN